MLADESVLEPVCGVSSLPGQVINDEPDDKENRHTQCDRYYEEEEAQIVNRFAANDSGQSGRAPGRMDRPREKHRHDGKRNRNRTNQPNIETKPLVTNHTDESRYDMAAHHVPRLRKRARYHTVDEHC